MTLLFVLPVLLTRRRASLADLLIWRDASRRLGDIDRAAIGIHLGIQP